MTTIEEIRDVLKRNGRFHYGALRDIADLAGCSTEHVKNILNGKSDGVSPLTKERVFTYSRQVALKLISHEQNGTI